MTITMEVLFEKLRQRCACRKNHPSFRDEPLKPLLIFDGDPVRPGNVYVIPAASLPGQDFTGTGVICVGEPGDAAESVTADMIIVEGESDLLRVFNAVQGVCMSLFTWDRRMAAITQEITDMSLLLEEGKNELPYTFLFLNNTYEPVAYSGELRDSITEEASFNSLFNTFLSSTVAADTARHTRVQRFSFPDIGVSGMYMNMYYNADYRGKLIAMRAGTEQSTDGDCTLFETLCSYARSMFRLYSVSDMRSFSYRVMQQLLQSMLETGSDYLRADVLSALQSVGWDVNDEYVVYFTLLGAGDNIPSQGEYIVTLMENYGNLGDKKVARGTVLSNGVAWVVNLSRLSEDEWDSVAKRFSSALGKMHVSAGMSTICRDFFNLRTFLRQAAIALRYGMREKPDETVHYFGRYSLDYMLDSAVGDFQTEDMIHPCLPILTAYDRENNTDYARTLRVFIACKYNVLQASSELFIHRSTFSARLKRIESLSHIDLDDERTRLHIMMSFYILERFGAEQK